MSPDEDLPILVQQEQLLRFRAFGADEAWQLGSLLRQKLLERDAGGSVEIEVEGHLQFACATAGAKPDQANWIRRKRNTVRHFGRSTYAVGRELERDGATLQGTYGLSDADYVAHGGGFPLTLEESGIIGSVILSGLPQREDHNLVVAALSELLEINVPRLRG